jgi:putative membrane protein
VRAPSLPSLVVSHWVLSAQPVLAAAAAALVYLVGVGRIRGRWPLRLTLSFLGGLGVVVVALESGIDTFDDRLLSVHMVQHMLLLLVAPLLLLGGRPLLLALRAAPRSRRRALVAALDRLRPVTGPIPCLAAFTVIVLGAHVPAFYDATLAHPLLHQLEHLLFVIAGLLLWWPLLDGDPVATRRLGGLGRLVYILAAMAPMGVVGAYLNRAVTVVYAPYGPAAHVLGISALNDQAQAGAIMWVAGDVIMVAVGLWAAVAGLLAEERRQQREDRRAGSLTAPRPGAGV